MARKRLRKLPFRLQRPPAPQDTAERRQVTVMFSDLVGSTALSARMDPEDLREVISAYQKSVAGTVERFGGFVAKYMGDGVLVYFGYPQAHEDDAERAVRAGLELIQAVAGLKSSVPLQTRVGIATGLVVVGDLIGSGAAQEQAVVGETPNVAARLQSLAGPNTVVIAEGTRKLLGNLFHLQDLGAQELKGIGGPVRAWAVLRSASVESRFEALHAAGLTELVGREEELELLLRRWSKAKTGEGQVVLISGEAGIGKSRLTVALLERLAGEPHARLRYFCSPQHTDSALYPIISQMERAAGLTYDDTAQVKLDKVDALLVQTATSTQDISLFAEMLSLPSDGRYPVLELTPQQRRQKTLEAFVLQVAALARQNAVLMIFEDAHWADPTSLEAFSRVVDRLRTLRALLIVTFRPEFDPPWIGRPHVTPLTVNRLAQRDIEAMIHRVVGNKLFPLSIQQDIIERTDGIPLFVEEMTKAVLEAGSEGAAQRTIASMPSPTLAVPASLQASLMARLDRLGSAKEVAQIASAIGREFSHPLLSAVVGKPDRELASALDRLIATGLLFRQGVSPHASYLFKHALVQDAAYGTLLRSKRQELHRRIVQVLDERFQEVAVAQPELLAHHSAEGGMVDQAVDYWLAAGERALRTSANIEAIKHLSQGLRLLTSSLPETPARNRKELRFQTMLGPAFTTTRGWAAPEAAQAYHRADELGRALGDSDERFKIVSGLWLFHTGRGEIHRALEFSDELFRLAEKRNDDDLRLQAHHSACGSLTFHGDFATSREHTKQGIAIYNPARHRSHALAYHGHDPGVCGWAQHGLDLWFLGSRSGRRAGAPRGAISRRNHASALGGARRSLRHFLSSIPARPSSGYSLERPVGAAGGRPTFGAASGHCYLCSRLGVDEPREGERQCIGAPPGVRRLHGVRYARIRALFQSRLSGGLSWCRRRPDGARGGRGCNTLRGGSRSVLLERGTAALEGGTVSAPIVTRRSGDLLPGSPGPGAASAGPVA